ncbi:hypothetical protein BO85DRAFT_449518 [Aspergillus piperis CBS 112811]|uniref:Uncharacterized protein n=1 Tax=Aspergillus piperis CBS 112811 TaxID=1448313 RepID=A0A8G1R2M4_9EURO|nr:hypothetical protein BO85DRAFT_449518 [Aspergillus piperis CBS 112811]RAH57526.1 hypothetical protein BO85DRAFT_449518 [Aspergillus piperis CBS 112811]
MFIITRVYSYCDCQPENPQFTCFVQPMYICKQVNSRIITAWSGIIIASSVAAISA